MFVTRKALSRRTLLRGVGATVALPWLDAMTAAAGRGRDETPPRRLIAIEMVHGAAGSAALGAQHHMWSPAAAGRDFDLAPTSLRDLAPFREHLTIVTGTSVAGAESRDAREFGGDHLRSSAVFLTQTHPKLTDGADVEAGISLDQLYAARAGGDTPIPSLQLCIEDTGQGGTCGTPYACAYTDTISWASATQPLPMLRDPRVVFDQLFAVLGGGPSAAAERARRADERSILDWLGTAIARLRLDLGPADRRRLGDHLEHVREIERRLQVIERLNRNGDPRALPGAPAGVPDSFTAHVRLLMDLIVVALRTDTTRVVAFKLGRDNSNRVYPESGFRGAFHPTSHHGGALARLRDFATLNTFHVGQLAYLLQQLRDTSDGGATLLDQTAVLYGSPMGDSNLHNHARVPCLLAGHAGGAIRGGTHVVVPDGTPLANVWLSVLHALGCDDARAFGDSTGPIDLVNA